MRRRKIETKSGIKKKRTTEKGNFVSYHQIWLRLNRFITKGNLKWVSGTGENSQWLGVCAAFVEDVGWLPSIHTGWLTVACNSSSKGSNVFWLLHLQICNTPHTHTHNTHMYTHIYTPHTAHTHTTHTCTHTYTHRTQHTHTHTETSTKTHTQAHIKPFKYNKGKGFSWKCRSFQLHHLLCLLWMLLLPFSLSR